MSSSNQLQPLYSKKSLSNLTNKDVRQFVSDYINWLYSKPRNVTFSQFCKDVGIPNPYQFKNYLLTHFTGLNHTVDFQKLWEEAEHIREDKLIELGIFEKNANANFIQALMKSRFGWHENVVVAGVSVEDILSAKKLAEGSNETAD